MSRPQFEVEEVFRCIEMDKATSYVIVEGNEPDIYDNALRGLLQKKGQLNSGWVVESGSDKNTILSFRKRSKAKNFFSILDHDFDGEEEPLERVSYLSRYSIENYLFDEMVIKQVISRSFKKSPIKLEFSPEELVSYYKKNLIILLSYVQSYQKSPEKKNIAWSDEKILKKDCWEIANEISEKLIENIKADHPEIVPTGVSEDDFLKMFPAKMLVRGIYFYIKKKIAPPKFSATFNNEAAFYHSLLSAIEHSLEFILCLKDAKEFLSSRIELSA